jgi:hypothetical protein
MKITASVWNIILLTIASLLLSSFSASAMVMHDRPVSAHFASDTQSAFSDAQTSGCHTQVTHSVKPPQISPECPAKLTHYSDCCDIACGVSFVFLPLPVISTVRNHQLSLIHVYEHPLTSVITRSRYRPPIV